MNTQERVYFASHADVDVNSTETRQAIAVVEYTVMTSRAPAIVALVVWLTTSILLLFW